MNITEHIYGKTIFFFLNVLVMSPVNNDINNIYDGSGKSHSVENLCPYLVSPSLARQSQAPARRGEMSSTTHPSVHRLPSP